jgi:Trp operon repressor
MSTSGAGDMATVFKGNRRLIDSETGEIIEAQTIVKTAGDAGFHKIWLHHILDAVDEVGNAKMRVLMWLLSKANAQNQILATKREIAEATGVGTATVQRLMAALKNANVITETRRSVWRLNPDVVFKGDHNKRMAVLIKYQDESQGDLFEEAEQAPVPAETQLRSVA